MLARRDFRNALVFFQAGELAFRSGTWLHDGPHRPGTREQIAWQTGWESAEEEQLDLDSELRTQEAAAV